MSRSLNRVELLGHLGQDAETRFTTGGVSCTSFSLATNRRWKDKQSGEFKEETDWHRCVLWRGSEGLLNCLLKGKQVFIEGRLQTRQWDDHGTARYTTEVIVMDVLLLGGGAAQQQGQGASASRGPRPGQTTSQAPPEDSAGGGLGVTDDDVPF